MKGPFGFVQKYQHSILLKERKEKEYTKNNMIHRNISGSWEPSLQFIIRSHNGKGPERHADVRSTRMKYSKQYAVGLLINR